MRSTPRPPIPATGRRAAFGLPRRKQVVSWAGKEYIVEDVFYQDGWIKHLWRLEDEEGNLIEQTVDRSFPAPWLADMTTLQAFDLSRFPVLGYTEYEGEWPDRPFSRRPPQR